MLAMRHYKKRKKGGTLSPEALSSNARGHQSKKNSCKHQGPNVNLNHY